MSDTAKSTGRFRHEACMNAARQLQKNSRGDETYQQGLLLVQLCFGARPLSHPLEQLVLHHAQQAAGAYHSPVPAQEHRTAQVKRARRQRVTIRLVTPYEDPWVRRSISKPWWSDPNSDPRKAHTMERRARRGRGRTPAAPRTCRRGRIGRLLQESERYVWYRREGSNRMCVRADVRSLRACPGHLQSAAFRDMPWHCCSASHSQRARAPRPIPVMAIQPMRIRLL